MGYLFSIGDSTEEAEHKDEPAMPTVLDVLRLHDRPNLPRLLSISTIIVALVVAGSLAIEDAALQKTAGSEPAAQPVVESTRPDPYEERMVVTAPMPEVDPADAPNPEIAMEIEPVVIKEPQIDDSRVQLMERRLGLLEKQIVVLQEQAKADQETKSDLSEKVAELEVQVIAARKPSPKQVISRLPKADPPPAGPVRIEAAGDRMVTGTVSSAAPAADQSKHSRDIASLVNPEALSSTPLTISRTRFALSLDMHDSIDALTTSWARLKATHRDLLSDLEPRALTQGTQEGHLVYRLLAGPFDNAASAARHCAKLKTRKVKCSQTLFGGQVLDEPPSPGTLVKVEMEPPAAGPLPLAPELQSLVANPPLPRKKPGS